jgi:hypothetical protein
MIEKIRVNTRYESLPFQPTQAELISFLLMIAGLLMIFKAETWFSSNEKNG